MPYSIHAKIAYVLKPYIDATKDYIKTQEQHVKEHQKLSETLNHEFNEKLKEFISEFADDFGENWFNLYIGSYVTEPRKLIFEANLKSEYLLYQLIGGQFDKFERELIDEYIHYVYRI
jgi:hypothetical protein